MLPKSSESGQDNIKQIKMLNSRASQRELQNWPSGASLVIQWLRLHTPNAGGLDSIPFQGTRSHILQLRVHRLQLKILQDTRKTEDPEGHN